MNEFEVRSLFEQKSDEIVAADGAKFSFLRTGSINERMQPDMFAKLEFGGKSTLVVIEVKSNGRPGTVRAALSHLLEQARAADALPMLVAPHIGPNARAILQENNVMYADLSGNKWIRLGGLYIDVRGHSNKFKEERQDQEPFADKASLVIRAMFEKPLRAWKVHELANMLEISPGFVSKVTRSMRERGYVVKSEDGLRLINARSILDDWVHAYSYRKNRLNRYSCTAPSAKAVIEQLKKSNVQKLEYALSLQAGAYLVAPHADFYSVHIYAGSPRAHEALVERLDLRKVDSGENVVILDPYYKKSAFYGKRRLDDVWVASDLQLYIDLYNYPLRGREQAEHLYRKALAPIAEKISEARAHD